jgi:aminoglycoside phosphotransferase
LYIMHVLCAAPSRILLARTSPRAILAAAEGCRIDAMRATSLTDQIRELLRRHLPDHNVRTLTRLGEGADHLAYEVNGELIVRLSKEDDAARRSESTRREADLLAVVARWSTLPVPKPILVDAEAGVLAYARLPGVPLLGRRVAEPARLAAALGEFLSRLHRAPLNDVETLVERDTYSLLAWREEAERAYRAVAQHLPAAARRRPRPRRCATTTWGRSTC